MKYFEQPLSTQVKLYRLEQKQNQAEQRYHLQGPRDTAQGSGEAQCRDTHGTVGSGLLADCSSLWLTPPEHLTWSGRISPPTWGRVKV